MKKILLGVLALLWAFYGDSACAADRSGPLPDAGGSTVDGVVFSQYRNEKYGLTLRYPDIFDYRRHEDDVELQLQNEKKDYGLVVRIMEAAAYFTPRSIMEARMSDGKNIVRNSQRSDERTYSYFRRDDTGKFLQYESGVMSDGKLAIYVLVYPQAEKNRFQRYAEHMDRNFAFDSAGGRLLHSGGPTSPNLPARAPDSTSGLLVRFVNQEREKAGLRLLDTNEKLYEAAAIRARELAQRLDINRRPDGRDYKTVLSDNGLQYARVWSTGSIFENNNTLEIYQAFYEDAEFRRRILSKDYTNIGIGIFKQGNDYFCVQILCGR